MIAAAQRAKRVETEPEAASLLVVTVDVALVAWAAVVLVLLVVVLFEMVVPFEAFDPLAVVTSEVELLIVRFSAETLSPLTTVMLSYEPEVSL